MLALFGALMMGSAFCLAMVSWPLIVVLAVLAAASATWWLTVKYRLPKKTAWTVNLAVPGLLLLGGWFWIQPPSEWPSDTITISAVNPPERSVKLKDFFTPTGSNQDVLGEGIVAYPGIEAARKAADLSGHKTTIFYNPQNPQEISTQPRPGWLGTEGMVVEAELLPAPDTPVSITGTYHIGLESESFTYTMPDGPGLPRLGQRIKIYTNPADPADLSLIPQTTGAAFTAVPLLILALIDLAGAITLGAVVWRERHLYSAIAGAQFSSLVPAAETLPTDQYTPALLRRIDWYQFERLIARLLQYEGHEVSRQEGTNEEGGTDFIAVRDGRKIVVQCRHSKNWRVQDETIEAMLATLQRQEAHGVSLYTLSANTRPADQFARNQGIAIITEGEIFTRLKSISLAKFQDLLDPDNKQCPRCDSPMELRRGTWLCRRAPQCQGRIETGDAKPFPGFATLNISYDELTQIVGDPKAHLEWYSNLSAVAGIYLITDSVTGEQYVGSAYGENGIFGRWCDHARNGDGGIPRLRQLLREHPGRENCFSFSILQTLDITMPRREGLVIEAEYRKKLESKSYDMRAGSSGYSIPPF